MLERHKLERVIISNQAILGIWKAPTGLELCRTLENPFRTVIKDSAIPNGVYTCVKDDTGKFKFYKVLNVPNRKNIEIHQGNYEDDTEGCILVGEAWAIMNNQLAVTRSNSAIERLKSILPEKFELEIFY
jgi:hypothetical protein